MSWTICYRAARGGVETRTDIREASPGAAWMAWGAWVAKHKVFEYYATHALEVDKVQPEKSAMTESEKPVMTHLYAVPNPEPATPATPTKSMLAPSSFPGLQATEIWPPTESTSVEDELAAALPPPPTVLAKGPIPVDSNKWPATAAFDRDDELALWKWTYRVWSRYRMLTMPKPRPGQFLRGTLSELIAVWTTLGASVNPESKHLDLHVCYIKGRWAGMIRLDQIHTGTYITTMPEVFP